MSYQIPPDILLILVKPDSTFDDRKLAIQRLAADAWGAGWQACWEEVESAMKIHGIENPLQIKVN